MNVPFFGIDRMYKTHSKQILQIIDSVYSSGRVLQGSAVSEFEKKIAEYCDRKYAVAVGSCTDALYFALLSAGISKDDEVLVTSFSFVASASAIVRIGAKPVFVDIEPDYYMMELTDLESKITEKTKAIVAVHLFGQTLPIQQLEDIAEEYNIALIEDAAQSLGSTCGERKAGSMGIMSCISFDPTKILGAFGSGGVLLTNDLNYYKIAKKLRYHGKNIESGQFEIIGYNSQLPTGKASLLSFQLDFLESWILRRQEIARTYTKKLSSVKQIILPKISPHSSHIFHKFVISTDNPSALKDFLIKQGIQTMTHYAKAIHQNQSFMNVKHDSSGLSTVYKVTKSVISLPIYPELSQKEVLHICSKIKKFYSK